MGLLSLPCKESQMEHSIHNFWKGGLFIFPLFVCSFCPEASEGMTTLKRFSRRQKQLKQLSYQDRLKHLELFSCEEGAKEGCGKSNGQKIRDDSGFRPIWITT